MGQTGKAEQLIPKFSARMNDGFYVCVSRDKREAATLKKASQCQAVTSGQVPLSHQSRPLRCAG